MIKKQKSLFLVNSKIDMAQNLIKVPDILATGRYKLTGESLLMLIILVNFELSLGNI